MPAAAYCMTLVLFLSIANISMSSTDRFSTAESFAKLRRFFIPAKLFNNFFRFIPRGSPRRALFLKSECKVTSSQRLLQAFSRSSMHQSRPLIPVCPGSQLLKNMFYNILLTLFNRTPPNGMIILIRVFCGKHDAGDAADAGSIAIVDERYRFLQVQYCFQLL